MQTVVTIPNKPSGMIVKVIGDLLGNRSAKAGLGESERLFNQLKLTKSFPHRMTLAFRISHLFMLIGVLEEVNNSSGFTQAGTPWSGDSSRFLVFTWLSAPYQTP